MGIIYWFTQELSTITASNDWFSEKEKAILNNLNFTKRRSDWRLGRFTAKEAITRFMAQNNQQTQKNEIEILAQPDGSPKVFLEGKPAPFSISISHSHNKAMCTINPANEAIGCDLEFLEDRSENFVKDYFTDSEMVFIKNAVEENKQLASNLIWCAKESVLKALKEGLRLDTCSVKVKIDSLIHKNDWTPFTAKVNETMPYQGLWKYDNTFVYTAVSPQLINLKLL